MTANSDLPHDVAGSVPLPDPLSLSLRATLTADPIDLAGAALIIARLEHPRLDAARSRQSLTELGLRAAERLKDIDRAEVAARVRRLNRFFYGECGFAGNRENYSDIRNSLLNIVLDRRLGIPITLAVVYMDVARRAGLLVRGIAFPGHFLLHVPAAVPTDDLVIDPFNGGAALREVDCRTLLASQMGDEVPFHPELLRPCSPTHLIARLLNNLKRIYIDLRAYTYARRVSDLLLAVDPTLLCELRDRGLLSFHLDDFPAALRDLEDYLRLNAWSEASNHQERDELQGHIRSLRRRMVSLN